MKVLCIKNYIDDSLAKEVGLPDCGFRNYSCVTPQKEYVVLGVSYNSSKEYHAGKPFVDIRDDEGDLMSIPLFLFKVIDDNVSKYWKLKFKDNMLTLYPESFYQYEYYHEDLADGVPEIKADFEKLCDKFEVEAKRSKPAKGGVISLL